MNPSAFLPPTLCHLLKYLAVAPIASSHAHTGMANKAGEMQANTATHPRHQQHLHLLSSPLKKHTGQQQRCRTTLAPSLLLHLFECPGCQIMTAALHQLALGKVRRDKPISCCHLLGFARSKTEIIPAVNTLVSICGHLG